MLNLLSLIILFLPSITYGATYAELPRTYVDTTYQAPTGRVLLVTRASTDARTLTFQMALNQASLGDVIVLEAGQTFTGPFVLPAKSGSGYITIRTSAPDSSLPPSGTRITPAYSNVLPKLQSAEVNGYVIKAGMYAHHYWFMGVEMRPSPNTNLFGIVLFGYDASGEQTVYDSVDKLPHHMVFDRVYLHGDPTVGSRRGIALNSSYTAIIDSYISDFKQVGYDTQALAGWNGSGPFKIVNNYLEAAGENIMFGGDDPRVAGLIPSDIEIRNNYIVKPLRWKIDDPSYEGTHWTVKNLLELKLGRRILIQGNIFENSWADAQTGQVMVISTANASRSPWSVTEDITIKDNIIRHAAYGLSVQAKIPPLSWQTADPNTNTKRVTIKNNLLYDIGGPPWTTYGSSGLFLGVEPGSWGVPDLIVEHNTAVHIGTTINAEGVTSPNFVFRDNIVFHNVYGVMGNGAVGTQGLELAFAGYTFQKVVLVGVANGLVYPPNNFYSARTIADVGFVDYASGNFHLGLNSPYRWAATDGTDVGADIGTLESVTIGVISGNSSAPFAPPQSTTTSTTMPLSTTSSTTGTQMTTTTSISTSTTTDLSSSTVKQAGKFLGKLKQLMDKVR